MSYSLSDFNLILEKGLDNELSEETLNIITHLANLVGSPEYIKTPQFKNRVVSNNNHRRKKKQFEMEDSDWENFRTFQATEFETHQGVEKNIDIIRKNLNMLTSNNYTTLKENIIEEIKKCKESNGYLG